MGLAIPEPDYEPSLRTFSDGDLHIDFGERLIIYDTRPAGPHNRAELDPAEAAVLALLIEHRHERPLWGAQLCEFLWGNTEDESALWTQVLVARLQDKLGAMELPRCPVAAAPAVGVWYHALCK